MAPDKSKTIIGLGELLWDLLPGGKQLGGAPANFAYWATRLGNHGIIASRVGDDNLGREAIESLKLAGVDASYVQLDLANPTGTVRVVIDESGQPDFTIIENVAWDSLEWTLDWKDLAAKADAICFGSPAQRSSASRETIEHFIQSAREDALIVFDINLRQSFYSPEIIVESLKYSRLVKLNSDELQIVLGLSGVKGMNDPESCRMLLDIYELDLICVTRGDHGSLLVTASEAVEHPGFKVTVADTVGAGDAFTAALIHHYLNDSSLQEISEAANRLGSWVASQPGGMPEARQDLLTA